MNLSIKYLYTEVSQLPEEGLPSEGITPDILERLKNVDSISGGQKILEEREISTQVAAGLGLGAARANTNKSARYYVKEFSLFRNMLWETEDSVNEIRYGVCALWIVSAVLGENTVEIHSLPGAVASAHHCNLETASKFRLVGIRTLRPELEPEEGKVTVEQYAKARLAFTELQRQIDTEAENWNPHILSIESTPKASSDAGRLRRNVAAFWALKNIAEGRDLNRCASALAILAKEQDIEIDLLSREVCSVYSALTSDDVLMREKAQKLSRLFEDLEHCSQRSLTT